MEAKAVKQENLTAECWMVQIFGLEQCEACQYKGKRDCGGKNIRKTKKNEKGLAVPIS